MASKSAVASKARKPQAAIDIIAAAPMFCDLAPMHRQALASEAREVNFAADTVIFNRGDPGIDVFIVAQGRVRLSVLNPDGRLLSFNNAEVGAVFGEIAAFDGGPRTADATAMTDVLCYVLPSATFVNVFAQSPAAAQQAFNFLCGRIRATSAQVEDIALHSITVRIARFMISALRLSRTPLAGNRTATLNLQMSQAEMADLLGASRQKINLALSHLAAQDVITRRKTVYTCNVALLRKIARTD